MFQAFLLYLTHQFTWGPFSESIMGKQNYDFLPKYEKNGNYCMFPEIFSLSYSLARLDLSKTKIFFPPKAITIKI